MQSFDIASYRLNAQHIRQADFTSAADVVHHMGAMQAQDYIGSLWAIGLRSPQLTEHDITQAIESRQIVRTWPMRGTLHFIAADDVRWMLSIGASQIIAKQAGIRRQRGVDETVLAGAHELLVANLSGGRAMTRPAIFALFNEHGIATEAQRGITILSYFALKGLLCLGAHMGKQPTFVLLDEWITSTPIPEKDESLSMLASRYFASHGPASLRDFAGWGGLTLTDAKRGVEKASGDLSHVIINGTSYWYGKDFSIADTTPSAFLLPGFDEFMLGYKDRSAALDSHYAQRIVPGGNGMFLSTVVVDGRVVGTWKKVVRKAGITLIITPFEPIQSTSIQLLDAHAERYSDFIGLPIALEIAS